jgi:hypothetical protein
MERDVGGSFAQTIAETAVAHRPCDHHAADAQRRDRQGGVVARLAATLHLAAEQVHHRLEHRLERCLDSCIAARNVARQSNHRT